MSIAIIGGTEEWRKQVATFLEDNYYVDLLVFSKQDMERELTPDKLTEREENFSAFISLFFISYESAKPLLSFLDRERVIIVYHTEEAEYDEVDPRQYRFTSSRTLLEEIEMFFLGLGISQKDSLP